LLGSHFNSLRDVRVTVLGVAFKPGTDDIRESPSLPVIQALLDGGARVTVFDPVARGEAERHFGTGTLNYTDTLEEAVSDAQAVLLMTRWPEFACLPEIFAKATVQPLLVDGRRVIPRTGVDRYEGIGIGPALP
jgi:UDPglucose 6-dehydrogenase/GDP-mannose 6-dehydrogenase